jgi:hypothetical protein
VRPLELVLNLFLLLSLLPVAAATQVLSPLLALCRMPPVKGRSKLPYGPCANAACCFSIDIRCGCRCGHDDERDVVPRSQPRSAVARLDANTNDDTAAREKVPPTHPGISRSSMLT